MNILIGLIVLCFCTYVNCKIFAECNGKPSETYVASYRKDDNCRSYIYCNGESSFEDTCPLDLAFNPADLTCDLRENVYCDDVDDEDDDEDDSEMDNNVSPTMPSSIPSKIVTAATKQHPTPPGRPLNKTSKKSPMRSTPKGNSRRPVPTRKPLLGSSSTLRPKPSTPKPTRKTTRKTTSIISVSSNRPLPPAPITSKPSSRPKTTVSTRRPTKTSPPTGTESQIQNIPTPPGGHNVPSHSKTPVLTTLPEETEPTWMPIESTSYVSSTKSHPKTKAPSSSSLPTTKRHQTELSTSSSTIALPLDSIKAECIKKTAGSFADPDDCHYYYRCIRGVLNREECPNRFGWDAKSKMCTAKGCSKK